MTTLDQNTAPLSADRLAEIKAKLERAHTEIGEVAAQGPHRRFRMSVPSRPDRDTDLIISDALDAAEVLLAEVDRLTSDAYALDVELTKANAERADLANQVSVLRDHVAALESDARAALAIDWDTLRAQIGNTIAAGTAGAFSSARVLDEVMAAIRKAVQP